MLTHRSPPSTRSIRVVVTCTDRKTAQPHPDLQLRHHHGGLTARATTWLTATAQGLGPERSARDLYKGEHWSVVTRFAGQAMPGGWVPEVWVASAGYGLVPLNARLSAYGATFATGQADSVSPTGGRASTEHNQAWWARLASWKGPVPGLPRTIAELAAETPDAPVLFVGSASYLRAVTPDLLAARTQLAHPDLLSVISAGAQPPDLRAHLLPGDARLQHALNGSRLSLNARIAELVLANADRHDFERHRTAALLDTLQAEQPPLVVYDRTPLSDAEVMEFIDTQRALTPGVSRTELLRRLRANGQACEQKRFSNLFSAALERTSR